MKEKIRLSDYELQRRPTPQQVRTMRQQGMEPPCSGRYHDFHGNGVYRCACCGYELFSSREKSALPAKWPTFRAPITQERVTTTPQIIHFLVRTAVKCGRCDAHLGYMFPERRPPAWTRYLINSAALTFHEDCCQEPREACRTSGVMLGLASAAVGDSSG